MKENRFPSFLLVLFSLLIPFAILMGGVRAIMTPAFPAGEYRRAAFPPDPYGFSTAEREKWAGYAVRYLTNSEDISYLADLQDLHGSPIFNERELDHMVDVKRVVRMASFAWYAVLVISAGIVIAALALGASEGLRKALNRGGWLTIGLMAGVLIFLAVNFNSLFEQFHRLFFESGTWLFYANDTLIRLFPMEFWRDAFLLVLSFTLVVAIIIVSLTRKRKKLSPALPISEHTPGS